MKSQKGHFWSNVNHKAVEKLVCALAVYANFLKFFNSFAHIIISALLYDHPVSGYIYIYMQR